jgi:hypothetical protein
LIIPPGSYSVDAFLGYLVENTEKVFKTGDERKWLKTHLLFAREGWQNIFKPYGLEKWGEIWHFAIPETATSAVDFYTFQWDENLLSCFTASTEERYENTLLKLISTTPGISEAWIKPDVFEEMKNFMLTKYGASIYHFISTRSRVSNVPTRVERPEFNRRINYSGEDAGDVLKETQTLYGTLPKTIDFNTAGNKIQMNRNGLMVLRNVNALTTGIIMEITDTLLREQRDLLQTSKKYQTSTRTIGTGDHKLRVPSLVAGKIAFRESKFDMLKAKTLFGGYGLEEDVEEPLTEEERLEGFDFSFIDTHIADDNYSATVVDEQKGTVFGLSGDDETMVLIPKHRTTFESFVRFYVEILNSFDRSARLTTFSEQIAR